MNKIWKLSIALLLLFPSPVPAAVIHVPGDQPTIQAGIDAAVNGDIVLVADGTYTGPGNKDLDFWGKAITVKSENGPDNCIIDCQGTIDDPHRAFHFHSSEGEDSIVQGFTIKNGYARLLPVGDTIGAGAYCWYASPTFRNNVFTGNYSVDEGAGIYCIQSSSIIINNIFSDNVADDIGGGIFCRDSSLKIIKNKFINNLGGAISCEDSSPRITDNLILGNRTRYKGAGIDCYRYLNSSSPVIVNNIICGNDAFYHSGGGIALSGGNAVVSYNIISENHCERSGGGIYAGAHANIMNNVICDNEAEVGGGICVSASVRVINNTISGNSAEERGGGIFLVLSSSSEVMNTILWNNESPQAKEICIDDSHYPSTVAISYSNVKGGRKAVYVHPDCTLNWGPGMMDADPLFVRGPLGDFYLSQIDAGQSVHEYLPREAGDSPCVDAGYPGPQLESMIGTTRTDCVPDSGIVDIGYHYPLIDLQIFPNPGSDGAPGRDPGMVLVPGGEFMMGCHTEPCYSWQLPVHAVYVDAFYTDIYEVNNRQYCDYLNLAYRRGLIRVINGVVHRAGGIEPYFDTSTSNIDSRIHLSDPLEVPAWLEGMPGGSGGAAQFMGKAKKTFQENAGPWNDIRFTVTEGKQDHPVVLVSWYGAAAYANWRSERDGRTPCYDLTTWECDFNANGYRLPTDAEWEFAARGGEHDPYYKWPWGDTCDGSMANYHNSGDPYEGDLPETTPVGYFDGSHWPPGSNMANGYGLYDMAGNIWEICNDWMDVDYYSSSPYDNPQGPASGTDRVFRSGGWTNNSSGMRCATRGAYAPDGRLNNSGIRLVLDAD